MSTQSRPSASTDDTGDAETARDFLAAIVALPQVCSNCLARKPDRVSHFRSVGGCHDEQLADRFCPVCGTGTGKDPAMSIALNGESHLSIVARREVGGTLARQCPPLPIRGDGLTFITVCDRAHARLRELDFEPGPLPRLRKAGIAAKERSLGRDHDALAAGVWAVLSPSDRRRARDLTAPSDTDT